MQLYARNLGLDHPVTPHPLELVELFDDGAKFFAYKCAPIELSLNPTTAQ